MPQGQYLRLLYVTLFQVMIGFGVVIPVLPYVVTRMGAGPVEMGLLVTVWAGGQFVFSSIWGSLSDRIGRRPVILAGLVSYALTFGLMAAAPSVEMLIAARALGGILSAATIPAAQAYVADVTEGRERARQMAQMGAAMNLGFLAGPMLGGLLTPMGYQAAFLVSAALAVLNTIVTYFSLPEPPVRARRKAVATGGLRTVLLALQGSHSLFFLLAFAATFGGSSLFSMLGLYMIHRHRAPEWITALAFTVEGLTAALMQGLAVGALSSRYGEVQCVRGALVSGIAGFSILALAPSPWVALAGVALIATATAFLRPLAAGLVSRHTPLEQGITMGLQSAFDALGRTVAPLWAGAVFRMAFWAPFVSAIAVYAAFLAWLQRTAAARRRDPAPAD